MARAYVTRATLDRAPLAGLAVRPRPAPLSAAVLMVVAVASTLGACTAGPVSSPTQTAPPASPTISPSSSLVQPSPCASPNAAASWPPYAVPDHVPGISVQAVDSGHTEITNSSDRTYFYRVSRWPSSQTSCSAAREEAEVERGPVGPGSNVVSAAGSSAAAPLTVAIWDQPCGEGCSSPPIGVMVVPVSSIKPGAT